MPKHKSEVFESSESENKDELNIESLKKLNIGILKGDHGPKGEQGKRGHDGKRGPRGHRGHRGHHGPMGVAGETGLQGIQGIQGVQGPQGVQGDQGVQGPQGEQGVQGLSAVNVYSSYYNDVLQPVIQNGSILFNNSSYTSSDITYNAGVFTLVKPGSYLITFYINAEQATQIALFLNNSLHFGSTFNTAAGSTVITTVLPNQILSLINTTNGPITLTNNNNGSQNGVNAYIVINKFA